ncbi:hypothetical protein ACIQM4_08120 [Streptomyces sp. NPDC091272]|uniref:hypothetical protein n=1 Tax=Streptomyces sp. NPDC091272 TaxID=3365981 RepID=UPI0038300201
MSAPEREVEKPMTPAAPAPVTDPVTDPAVATEAVTMSALLASCAAATAVSTPPDRTAPARRPRTQDKGTAGQRDAA